ncbi:DUF2393 family protein [Sulfurimonas sp.]|uniref:DUF2393 family protein n=1 Tax=Sulfurimonas sp. TaxID=2022749 RepID=UPI002B499876|nr:DUF2393 family protein [Sulfurimonas sp.]
MKSKTIAFINNLISYDYMLFGGTFILFLFLIIIGIILRRKTVLAIFFILSSFIILLGVPTIGYVKMHEFLFKNALVLTSEKKLTFTEAVVIKGTITNNSKRYFNRCKVTAKAYKVSNNKLKNFLFSFKAFQKISITIEDIEVGQTKELKMFLEPFYYSKKYNILLGAKCK